MLAINETVIPRAEFTGIHTFISGVSNLSSRMLSNDIKSLSMVQHGDVHFVHLLRRMFQKQTDVSEITDIVTIPIVTTSSIV